MIKKEFLSLIIQSNMSIKQVIHSLFRHHTPSTSTIAVPRPSSPPIEKTYIHIKQWIRIVRRLHTELSFHQIGLQAVSHWSAAREDWKHQLLISLRRTSPSLRLVLPRLYWWGEKKSQFPQKIPKIKTLSDRYIFSMSIYLFFIMSNNPNRLKYNYNRKQYPSPSECVHKCIIPRGLSHHIPNHLT